MKREVLIAIFAALVAGIGIYLVITNDIVASPKTDSKSSSAIMHTSLGNIHIKLLPEEAPEMVKNFTELAQEGLYDETIFHRVIPNFMIQGGDFENFNGTGGHSYKGGELEDEFSPNLSHVRGMLSMANRGPNTNGSQFFIMHADAPHLDGRHSIFGQVTKGLDILDRIATTETDLNDKPLEDVVLEKVEIE